MPISAPSDVIDDFDEKDEVAAALTELVAFLKQSAKEQRAEFLQFAKSLTSQKPPNVVVDVPEAKAPVVNVHPRKARSWEFTVLEQFKDGRPMKIKAVPDE